MSYKKRISIIGTNGLPAKYGGFETLTHYLSKNLSEDFDVTVYCSKRPNDAKLKEYNNSKLVYLPFRANGWQSIVYDCVSILHSLLRDDVLIVLGYTGVFVFPLKYLFKKKIILNIGGIEWQKVRAGRFASKVEVSIKKLLEKISIKLSDVVVTDNQVIFDYVKQEYEVEPKLIEYGGDHAIYNSINDTLVKKFPFLNSEYDLTVSRAQTDMNIHIVIDAYKKIKKRNLVIISNWNISEYGIQLKQDNYNKYENIFLLDAIYDLELLNIIRGNSRVYLHTHSLCGTAPSLVEAMSLGLPVVCFDVPTNRATTEEKTLYFKDAVSLQKIMENISDIEIKRIKETMQEIAVRRYTWSRIVGLYKNCIQNNVNNGK